jgi:hypothetical protein
VGWRGRLPGRGAYVVGHLRDTNAVYDAFATLLVLLARISLSIGVTVYAPLFWPAYARVGQNSFEHAGGAVLPFMLLPGITGLSGRVA